MSKPFKKTQFSLVDIQKKREKKKKESGERQKQKG